MSWLHFRMINRVFLSIVSELYLIVEIPAKLSSCLLLQLEAMGFRRATVLQVYFACNKNEELAANYLLDHIDEFDNEDEEGLPWN